MRLNLDILTVVVSHMIRRADMLAIMRTCKSVYAAGIPALLKRNVRFAKQDKLAFFCDFILADAPARGKHIRELEFCKSLGKIKKAALCEKVAQVLEHATGLETLTLASCDDFVASDEKIEQAFTQLKSVKDLTIREADATITEMVKQMQSPVEKVNITFIGMNDSDHNPVSVLSAFQETLRTLYAWQPEFEEPTSEVYPNMHNLDVVFWNNIDTEPLVRAFPNLRHLALDLQGATDGGLEEDKEDIREKNEQGQAEVQWTQLEHVSADDLNLYLAAIKANVKTLDLRVNWESETDQITAILSDMRPARLNLHFSTDWENEGDVPERLPGVLEAMSEDLTHLYMKIRDIDDPETAFVRTLHLLAS